MKRKPNEDGKRLWIQVGGLFDCPYEWTIVDFVYWKSNTQDDRRWTCRMKLIQRYTPVKRIETITDALDRLCQREIGFSKIPYGKPQRRRFGKGRQQVEVRQSNQYVFDAKVFDAWLKAQPPIRKRIDLYPKADSQLSENGKQTYPKTDTTIRKEEVKKKDIKEAVGSQPPSKLAAVAPKQLTGEEAEAFERFFRSDFHQCSQSTSTPEGVKEGNHEDGSQPPSPSAAPSTENHAASGGIEVGLASTPVALPPSDPPTIQDASGNSNARGQNRTDTFVTRVSAPIIEPPASRATNTRARKNTTAHPGESAHVASAGVAFGYTDAERQELASKGYTEDNIARMENAVMLEQTFGPRREKSRHGRDS